MFKVIMLIAVLLACCGLRSCLDYKDKQKDKQRRLEYLQKAKSGKGKLRITLRSEVDDQLYWS